MQALASEAIAQGHDAADPAALAAQITATSAALLGARQNAARSGPLMKKHHGRPAACSTARTVSAVHCRWRIPADKTVPSATSA